MLIKLLGTHGSTPSVYNTKTHLRSSTRVNARHVRSENAPLNTKRLKWRAVAKDDLWWSRGRGEATHTA